VGTQNHDGVGINESRSVNPEELRKSISWAIAQLGFENLNQWRLNALGLGYKNPPNLQRIFGRGKENAMTHWNVGTLVLLAEIFRDQGLKADDGEPIPLGFFLSALVSDFTIQNTGCTEITLDSLQRQSLSLSVQERAQLAMFLTRGLAKDVVKM
jgi:hypothetical protein